MNATRQELLALALGQLPPEAQQRVQQALGHDPGTRAALRRDLDALTSLLGDLDPVGWALPPHAEAQLLGRLQAESPPDPGSAAPAAPGGPHWPGGASTAPPFSSTFSGLGPPELPRLPVATGPVVLPSPVAGSPAPRRDRSWAWPALLSLGLALALGLTLRPASDLVTRYAAAPGAQAQIVSGTEGRVGRLVRLSDGRVYVQMDRALEAGRVYQLWRLLPGPRGRALPRSLGIFEAGLMTRAMPPSAVLAVSTEPPGGSDQPTSPLLFKQRLQRAP